jgi:formamidopyrimidine-DNA glycosylase
MPELPEVETVANGVHERVQSQRIERVWTSGKPQTFKSPESEHKVYGRAGETCKDCGAALKKLIVGGRTTVYCPTCQG